jgi:hypothetical protein
MKIYNLHNRTLGVDKQFPLPTLLLPIDIACNQQSYRKLPRLLFQYVMYVCPVSGQ